MHNTLMSEWRPKNYAAYCRKQLFLHKPMSFREEFDGILYQFGRWSYKHLGDVWERLVERQMDRRMHGGTDQEWEEDRAKVAALFERAGWTAEEFDNELDRRLEAKFA